MSGDDRANFPFNRAIDTEQKKTEDTDSSENKRFLVFFVEELERSESADKHEGDDDEDGTWPKNVAPHDSWAVSDRILRIGCEDLSCATVHFDFVCVD